MKEREMSDLISREALAALERANDALCAARPQHIYDAMIEAGQSDLLLDLDRARAAARSALRALPPAQEAAPAVDMGNPMSGQPVALTYRNWRGEVAERTITPLRVWFGSTDWHPEPQWLLTAWDVEKQAERDFALKDFGQPVAQEPVAWRYPSRDDQGPCWAYHNSSVAPNKAGATPLYAHPATPAPVEAALVAEILARPDFNIRGSSFWEDAAKRLALALRAQSAPVPALARESADMPYRIFTDTSRVWLDDDDGGPLFAYVREGGKP